MGEVTVTLEDVAHIFGLPIDGEPVSGWTDDKSTAYAHAKYLPLLRDFERIHTYSWGPACLAHLYRALYRASQYDTKRWMALLIYCLFGHGSECLYCAHTETSPSTG
ncbi:hypothetical protein AHAS_Ahas02G0131900 [Arachis hypogaea]